MIQLSMPNQQRTIFLKARILFVKDGCHICARWKEFIERENLRVPIGKKIRVINMTTYDNLGIPSHPYIKLFDKYIPEQYPSLFFEGVILAGANSRTEVESFIKARLHEDYVITPNNKFLFSKKCRKVKKGFLGKETIVCD